MRRNGSPTADAVRRLATKKEPRFSDEAGFYFVRCVGLVFAIIPQKQSEEIALSSRQMEAAIFDEFSGGMVQKTCVIGRQPDHHRQRLGYILFELLAYPCRKATRRKA